MSTLRPTDLSMRARLALVLIIKYLDDPDNVLHHAPAHSQIISQINAALPPHLSRGKIVPVLSSKEQSYRIANHLREAGLLVSAPGMQFNMAPTPAGRSWARQWADEVAAWTESERRQWQLQGKREAIRKLRAPLERSVA